MLYYNMLLYYNILIITKLLLFLLKDKNKELIKTLIKKRAADRMLITKIR